jgi:hypothetical protein
MHPAGLVIAGEVEMGSEIESAAADRAFRFRRSERRSASAAIVSSTV